MYCPKCGLPVEEEHSYCSQCGEELNEWGTESDHYATPLPRFSKKKTRWFTIVVLLSFILMVWGGYSSFNGEDNLSSLAKEELKAIRSNQITKAYYEYSSAQFRKEYTLEKFKEFIERNLPLTSFDAIEIEKSEKEKQYGVVFATLTLPYGKSASVKIEFTKEEREWRILSIEVNEIATPAQQEEEETQSKEIIQGVKRYIEALKTRQIEEIYNTMSSQEFKKAVDLESFRKFIESHNALTSEGIINMSIAEMGDGKAKVRVLIYTNETPQPVDYYMVREEGGWKVFSLYLLQLDGDKEKNKNNNDEERLKSEEAITDFLKLLKNGAVAEAYENTTTQFRKTTTLEQFQDFLKKYPLLIEGESKIRESAVSDDVGQVRVEFKSADEKGVVDFILSLQNRVWRVLGIQFVEEVTPTSGKKEILTKERAPEKENFDNDFLTSVIKKQIEEIKKRDLYSAYKDYTSTKFRASTPFDSFAKFIDQNGLFSTNRKILFEETSFDNNVAKITVFLADEADNNEEVEYDLVKEGDEWKILSIKLPNIKEENHNIEKEERQNSTLSFEKVNLGTKINLTGQVTNPTTKIRSNTHDIFATLYVKGGESGTIIEVFFTHNGEKREPPPLIKKLTNSGKSTISFIFSPPKTGWKTGKYLLKAKASTGEEKDFEFEIVD